MLIRLCLENRTGSMMAAPAHPAEEHPLYDGARWHDRPRSFVTESLSRKHDKLLCSITVTRLRNRCDDQLKLDERQRRLESLPCSTLGCAVARTYSTTNHSNPIIATTISESYISSKIATSLRSSNLRDPDLSKYQQTLCHISKCLFFTF